MRRGDDRQGDLRNSEHSCSPWAAVLLSPVDCVLFRLICLSVSYAVVSCILALSPTALCQKSMPVLALLFISLFCCCTLVFFLSHRCDVKMRITLQTKACMLLMNLFAFSYTATVNFCQCARVCVLNVKYWPTQALLFICIVFVTSGLPVLVEWRHEHTLSCLVLWFLSPGLETVWQTLTSLYWRLSWLVLSTRSTSLSPVILTMQPWKASPAMISKPPCR